MSMSTTTNDELVEETVSEVDLVETVAAGEEPVSRTTMEKLRAARSRHRARHWSLRAINVLGGILVCALGVLMIALPGPAFVVLPAGLTMLALEFEQAEKPLAWCLEKAQQAKAKLRK